MLKSYLFVFKSIKVIVPIQEKSLILNSFEGIKCFFFSHFKKKKNYSSSFLKLLFSKLLFYPNFDWDNISELYHLFFLKNFLNFSFFKKKNNTDSVFNPDFLNIFFNFQNNFLKLKNIKYLFLCFCNLRLEDPLLYFTIKKVSKLYNIKIFSIGGVFENDWFNLGNDSKTFFEIQSGRHWVSNFLDLKNVLFLLGRDVSQKNLQFPFLSLNLNVGNRNAQFLGLSPSSFFSKSKKYIGEIFFDFSLNTIQSFKEKTSIKLLASTHQPSSVCDFDFLLPTFSFFEKKGNYLNIFAEVKETQNLFGFQFDSMLQSFYNRSFHDHLVYDFEHIDIKKWRWQEKQKMLESRDFEHFFGFDPLNIFRFSYIFKVNENLLFEKMFKQLSSFLNKEVHFPFSFFYSFFLINCKLFQFKNNSKLFLNQKLLWQSFKKYSTFWSKNTENNIFVLNSLLTHQTFKRHYLPLQKKNY